MLSAATLVIKENKKTKARRIDLGRCRLSKVPEELFDCVWLEELIISNEWWDFEKKYWVNSQNDAGANHLSSISSSISKLTNLKILRAGGNLSFPWEISDTDFLNSLNELQYLDLSSNNITNVLKISQKKSLTVLNLFNNKISDVSSFKNLDQTRILDLSNNIISDFTALQFLPELQILNLCNNRIADIHLNEIEFLNLSLNLESSRTYDFSKGFAYLSGNNIENIPTEVLQQGNRFIIQYLKSQNKVSLNECKIIITGRGSAGKTSLQKRLFGEEQFNPVESETHGIRKRTWAGGMQDTDGNDIKVHFWDMGGQQEQQTLHQLFYTDNAVYILLLDKRVDEDPEYFLELIKVYGNNCPVIIVINNKIILSEHEDINYNLQPEFDSTLRDKYPNVRKIFGVCCGVENDHGVNELRKYLCGFIPTLDHVREKYPMEWLQIKNELIAKIDKNYIKFEEYEKLCIEKNVEIKELQIGLAKMLNNTGTITFFDKPYLNYYILNPDWVTSGAYEIILSPLTSSQGGRITFKNLKVIFSSRSIFEYTDSDYEFLMKLMLAYSLCHEFKEGLEWLIPSSLKGQPVTNLVKYKEPGNYRLYCLKYRTSLPQSIIHKFIARNINYAYKEDYWRNGIVLKHKDSNTLLFTEADYKEKEIRIWIRGQEILEAWKFFRKDFFDLSAKFEYDELVELEGIPNAMMSYKELINLSKNLKKEQLEFWYNPSLNAHVNILKTLVLFDDAIELASITQIAEPKLIPKIKIESPEKTDESNDPKEKEKESPPMSEAEQKLAVKKIIQDQKKILEKEKQLDADKKQLELEKYALEKERDNDKVRSWKRKSVYALFISLLITGILVLIYLEAPSFIMSQKQWVTFKKADYFPLIGIVLAFIWNSIIGKMFYDRVLDPSKAKAFRDQLKKT